MMRLANLSPRWILPENWARLAPPFYVGVSFLCPHCGAGPCPTCGHVQDKRLAVMFWPPIDPEGAMGRLFEFPENGGHHRLSGDSFDTLTLHPSIGLDPHFHGYITAGTVTTSYPLAPWVRGAAAPSPSLDASNPD